MEEKNFKGNEGADNTAPVRVRGGEKGEEYAKYEGELESLRVAICGDKGKMGKQVLDDTTALVNKIQSKEAYDEFKSGLATLVIGDEKEEEAPKFLKEYSDTLEGFYKDLRGRGDDLKERLWVNRVKEWISAVPQKVDAAEKAAADAWDHEGREHERFLKAHGYDPRMEQKNHTYPKDLKIRKGLPKFERSMPKFMAIFTLFWLVESFANGILYAQVEEGLIIGWLIAGIIAAGVLFFGWFSGILSSFLKGFERSGAVRGGRGTTTSSDAKGDSNRSKMAILALLVIVALLGGVYFYTHHEELVAKHGLRGTLVAVSAIVVVVGLIMFLWFGKGGTRQDVETAQENNYIPRPVWKRFSYGFGAFFSLMAGITLIMVAYLYREVMEQLVHAGELGEDSFENVANAVMQGVLARFGALDFLPQSMQSIILLLVNFAGFGVAVYKGHWMNGPFQNYKNSRIQYEGFGEKYVKRGKNIREKRDNCNDALDEIVTSFPGTVRDVRDLVNKINNEGLLQKRWLSACEKIKNLGQDPEEADAPSLGNIYPPELINEDEWGTVENMLADMRRTLVEKDKRRSNG